MSKRIKIWYKGRFKEEVVTFKVPEDAEYLVPPFSDPHIHGGWGYDFNKGDFEPLEEKLRSAGIRFAIPTLVNAPLEEIEEISESFEKYKKRRKDSIFPFLRMEGPFISMEKRGAQSLEYVLEVTEKNINRFLNIKWIKIFTFAPEIKWSEKLIEKALDKGKIPSIGHTDAKYEHVLKAYRMGVRHMTHFPNAMRILHHREVGVVGAGLLLDDIHLEIIGDLVHTSMQFLNLVLKIRGPVFSLISDLIPPANSDLIEWDGKRIQKSGREIRIENGPIAGGATMVPQQASLLFQKGIPPETIVKLACENAIKFFTSQGIVIKEWNLEDYTPLNRNFEPVM